jgi:hypothetical protein
VGREWVAGLDLELVVFGPAEAYGTASLHDPRRDEPTPAAADQNEQIVVPAGIKAA